MICSIMEVGACAMTVIVSLLGSRVHSANSWFKLLFGSIE
jgi:hypothetical protein